MSSERSSTIGRPKTVAFRNPLRGVRAFKNLARDSEGQRQWLFVIPCVVSEHSKILLYHESRVLIVRWRRWLQAAYSAKILPGISTIPGTIRKFHKTTRCKAISSIKVVGFGTRKKLLNWPFHTIIQPETDRKSVV